ncbi:MAG: MFS transporter [Promethearchaeota archaeon]
MNQQNTTLVITGAAHGLVHLLMLALPYITTKLLLVTPILPGSEWLVVLLLNTPAYFVFGFGAIPAGFLCDRIGPRKVIAMGLMLSVLSGIALFFLWPLGISVIAFFFMTYAFGAGLYHPAGTTWVSNTFHKNRGKALGRHGIGGSIGQMMAPLISALILSTIFWPVIFLFLAAIGIVIAFVTLRVRVQVYDVKVPPNSELKQGRGFFSFVTPVVMLVVSVILVARGMLYRGTVTALPVYITLELGALLVIAGFIGTLVYVGGIFGQEIGGRLTDRYGWPRTLAGMTLLCGGALLLLSIPYVPIIWSDLLLIAAVMLFGFSFFAAQAATNTMVADLSNPESRGQVFGWSFFTRFGLGALFGIPLVTLSFFIFGTWVAGFFLMALFSVVAALLIIFVHRRQQES